MHLPVPISMSGMQIEGSRMGHLWVWKGHANLYNGPPLSLTAKPQ
jgi:hypothetical protein